jgi:hypothetical protein
MTQCGASILGETAPSVLARSDQAIRAELPATRKITRNGFEDVRTQAAFNDSSLRPSGLLARNNLRLARNQDLSFVRTVENAIAQASALLFDNCDG